METLDILKNALNELTAFSETAINEETFQRTIAELKATLHKLRGSITDEKQYHQLNDILGFETLLQQSPLKRFFIRVLAPSKYGWFMLGWHKNGKYVYDLDQLTLKLGGLIYKVEQEQLQ